LVVDQVALHFSAFTLLRTINCASTVLIVVVLVSSHMLRASLNQIINNKMRLTRWSGGIRR
ncbi:MAG TPA: hypothetical protein V6C72_07290, partial [Chroococcales cyanobacterium]